jgi:hypothetical protein
MDWRRFGNRDGFRNRLGNWTRFDSRLDWCCFNNRSDFDHRLDRRHFSSRDRLGNWTRFDNWRRRFGSGRLRSVWLGKLRDGVPC